MSAIDLEQAIGDMREFGMNDAEILEVLKRGGYEENTLPVLDRTIPSANIKGTKPVITLEEITFEQRWAKEHKVTPANEAANAVMEFEISQRAKK